MNNPLAMLLCAVFFVLALWHLYMALLPSPGNTGAVPSVEGKPLFVPSVALSWLSYALALGLLGRAVGEFKYVGFSKRVRDSKFAALDTFVYSPLCLFLAAGVALVAWRNGT